MRFIFGIVSGLAVLLSLVVKISWIVIADGSETQRERVARFYSVFSPTFLWVVVVLALFSLAFFVYRLIHPQKPLFRALTIAGVAVQSLYLFLEFL